jgi:hypothetical protein
VFASNAPIQKELKAGDQNIKRPFQDSKSRAPRTPMSYRSVFMAETRNIPRELRLASVPSFAPASIATSQEPGKGFKTWERVIDGTHATIKV